jgi:hypothetical protein
MESPIKECNICHITKPLSEFNRYTHGSYFKRCKPCQNKLNYATRKQYYKDYRQTAKYKAGREERLKKSREYHQVKYRPSLRARPQIYLLIRARQRAKLKKLPFNLDSTDITVPEYCPVLGLKLLPHEKIRADNSPSLDRLIPALGYIKGNVRVISQRANQIKTNATIAEVEKVLAYMRTNGCN